MMENPRLSNYTSQEGLSASQLQAINQGGFNATMGPGNNNYGNFKISLQQN